MPFHGYLRDLHAAGDEHVKGRGRIVLLEECFTGPQPDQTGGDGDIPSCRGIEPGEQRRSGQHRPISRMAHTVIVRDIREQQQPGTLVVWPFSRARGGSTA